MKLQTEYEWGVEITDEHGDVVASEYSNTLSELKIPSSPHHLVLIRDAFGREGDCREWAYVSNGVLPEYFDNGTRVPKRFHKEIAK